MVHGRKIKGEVEKFGVSGYVYHDVFLMFDRKTESLWYPFDDKGWTAVAGPRKGEKLPFLTETPVVKLGAWKKKHPNTTVLLGSKSRLDRGR